MARGVRVELAVRDLEGYLVGILGYEGATKVVLEGEPHELRQWFRRGLEAVDQAELDRTRWSASPP